MLHAASLKFTGALLQSPEGRLGDLIRIEERYHNPGQMETSRHVGSAALESPLPDCQGPARSRQPSPEASQRESLSH